MKKTLFVIAFVCAALGAAFAQEVSVTPVGEVNLLNPTRYNFCFLDKKTKDIDTRYTWATTDEDYDKFSALSGDTASLDTPLEFALLSYYSQPVINIRPVEAQKILPANNPREAGLKLGAAVFKELVELKFLDPRNTAAIGRYEGMLKFISDKNGVSRAEIETYYRNGIRSLIEEAVNEEFSKVSVNLAWHNATLTYGVQNGNYKYTLSYGGVNTSNEIRIVTGSGNSLENALAALSSTMRNGSNKSDFRIDDLDTVREQAALIPAVVYVDWSSRLGIVNGLDTITNALTDFYLEPTPANYNILLGIYAKNRAVELGNQGNSLFPRTVINSLVTTLSGLHTPLAERVTSDMQRVNIRDTALALTGRQYQAFSTPFGIGNAGVSVTE